MSFDEKRLRASVALSCRILAENGHVDMTLGHVSARGPDDIVYIKRYGVGLDQVTPDDVITVDLGANKLAGAGMPHLETPLHTEIYKVRPDVMAVAHTHPPHAIALGATDAKLELLNHDAVLFFDGLGNFTETAGLITSAQLGKHVAEALGSRRAVLMRNHGVVVVGSSIPWLTYTALTLERAIQIQAIAQTLGPLSPLSPEVAEKLYAEKYRDEFVDSYWCYLTKKATKDGLEWDLSEGC